MRDPEAGIAAQFVARLYGEAYVESLRMRETVCRFVVVSSLLPAFLFFFLVSFLVLVKGELTWTHSDTRT